MTAVPQDPRRSIDYARKEAHRCAELAAKTGSSETKAVYAALRESWIRIADSLESSGMAAVPSSSKVDPEKSRSRLRTILTKQTGNSLRGNSAVPGHSCGDVIAMMPIEDTVTPSVAAALMQAKWCSDQATKAAPPRRDTYLRLRDGWIQVANEMQLLDRTERALLLSIDDRRRHREAGPSRKLLHNQLELHRSLLSDKAK